MCIRDRSSAIPKLSPLSANATLSSRATRSGSNPIPDSCICSMPRRGNGSPPNINGGMSMTKITRRTLVGTGTALAAAGALPGPALLDWAKAWAQTAPWKPEKGAALSLLRWKYFVQSEDDAFVKLIDAFTKATGVKVDISRESYEDVQPKASVAANTGAGPDLFWGLYSLPHLFPQKCMDMTDVADYLGKKYGGWVDSAVKYGKSGNKWIAVPICYSGALMNYRIEASQKAGFSKFTGKTDEFLEYVKAMKKNNTPGGFALGL